jgi:Na+:H+ antiporter, NhaA family
LLAVDREPRVSAIPFGPASRGVVFVPTRPLRLFVATEARSAIPLLSATVAALVWANSPWLASYEALWSTSLSIHVGEAELSKDLRHWVNDGLMTLFFLVVGLEISRQLKLGELRRWQMAAVPAAAALGGMVTPALLYLAFNPSGPATRGWAMAMAGDLAFALGVLALVGPRCPPQLRVFLLTLLLVGDVAAIAVAGLLYAKVVNVLALAVVIELFAVVTVLRLLRVLRTLAYLVVGVALWVATSASGVHPAIVGLLLGAVLTAYPPVPTQVLRGTRLSRWFEPDPPAMPWGAPPGQGNAAPPDPAAAAAPAPLVQLPGGAGVRAGQRRGGAGRPGAGPGGRLTDHPRHPHGAGGGHLLGIVGASLLAVRVGLGTLPRLAPGQQLAGAAALPGVGFTVALFVTDLAVTDRAAQDEAKIGILVASAAAAALGWLLLHLPPRIAGRRPRASIDPSAGGAAAPER